MRGNVLHPLLVSIEGNIGAGKTTLLQNLRRKHPEWTIIDEPVETWATIQNESGESILEVFYHDRRRWSYTFQNCALLTRHQNIEQCVQDAKSLGKVGRHVFLTERCLDTDYHVFTRMLRDEGSIDKLELELYHRLLNQLRSTSTPLSAIVHVNTKPSVCADRIKQRARSGEENIPLDYLQGIENHQKTWMDSTTLPLHVTDLTDIDAVAKFIEDLRVGTSEAYDLISPTVENPFAGRENQVKYESSGF